jgi:hypothetical protein
MSGEITFKTGDEVTVGGPGTCAFLPRGVPHAWKNTGGETGRVLFLYTPAGAGGFLRNNWAVRPGRAMDPKPTKCDAGTGGRSSVRRLSSRLSRSSRQPRERSGCYKFSRENSQSVHSPAPASRPRAGGRRRQA